MDIREIRVADDAFADWFATYHAATVADDPTGPQWTEDEARVLFEPHEYRDRVMWLASEESRPIGAAILSLPLRDNLQLGEPEVYVHPDARRRGIGTALLHVVERAAHTHGRRSLLTYLSSGMGTPQTAGTLFAERHGFTRRIDEVRRVLNPPFPFDAIDEAVAAARPHAADYELVTWRDQAPDKYVHEYARLEARLSTDAPLGDLDYEGEVWDEARIRKSEERCKLMDRGLWLAAAVAPDGQMAGLTEVTISKSSDRDAFQGTTIVDPEHRGHRLGILLKAANFKQVYADRPGIEQIWTWNAESNSHMIAVNETMGYRVEGWDRGYQRDVRA